MRIAFKFRVPRPVDDIPLQTRIPFGSVGEEVYDAGAHLHSFVRVVDDDDDDASRQ